MNIKNVIAMIIGLVMIITPSYASSTYLIADINKETVNKGDVIKVYGYAYDNYQKSDLALKIYLNGELYSVVHTNEHGYFEKYIQINEVGLNVIEVKYKTLSKQFKVLAKQTTEPNKILESISKTQANIIIVIDNDGKQTYYGSKPDSTKNIKEYVSFELSTKELNIDKYGGSKLEIIIDNHMKETHLFDVTLNMDDEDYYKPQPLELKPLEKGKLYVYVNPLNPEKYDGKTITLEVYMDDKKIGEKKFVIQIVNKKDKLPPLDSENIKALYNIDLKGIIALIMILFGVGMLVYGYNQLSTQQPKLPQKIL